MELLLLAGVAIVLIGYAWWAFHLERSCYEEESAIRRDLERGRSEEEPDE